MTASLKSSYRHVSLVVLGLVLGSAHFGLAASAAAQEIKLSPSSIQFGRVTGTKTRTIKIQNKGNADLMVGPIGLCAGTSAEFTFSPASAQIPARRSADLDVSYAPSGSGDDSGCLDIPSNDPDDPVVQLRVAGSGARADGGELRLRPTSLDFGRVTIGSVATRSFQAQVTGGAGIDVTIAPCAGTSTEFTVGPAQLTVMPGRGSAVDVTYQPADTGTDNGCVELQRVGGAQGPLQVRVTATGVDQAVPPTDLDLDIHDFKVKKESRLKSAQAIQIRLWVKNSGTQNGSAPATVIGSQNGAVVYQNTLRVSDRPGNEGVSKYTFPSFTPTQEGDVVWTATIDDGDPDVDTATAVTRVIGDPVATSGVDLDIRRFRVTGLVSVATGKAVQLRLAIQNNGTVDGTRNATLIGIQNGIEIYNQVLAVADAPGNRSATNYRFPELFPSATGEIVWMVVVDDDDIDVDEAFAVTRVVL